MDVERILNSNLIHADFHDSMRLVNYLMSLHMKPGL